MSLRGVIRGRTIELEQEPPLPDGTQVEVELRLYTAEPLFERLYTLWQLTPTEPLPSLEEACRQAVRNQLQEQPQRCRSSLEVYFQ